MSPNPTGASSNVNAIVSGLSNCNGFTVTIKDYQGCTSGATIATFIGTTTGGSVIFKSPGSNGQYGYYACVNGKSSTKSVLTVSKVTTTTTTTIPTTSTVSTTTTITLTTSSTTASTTTSLTTTAPTTSTSTITTSTSTTASTSTSTSTTTISNSCSGTPSLTLSPNPAGASSNVNAIVSGLSNCNGFTVTIKDYLGCTSGATIATFVGTTTGGSVIFKSPGANGQYGYYACVNGKGSAKAILTVS